MLSEGGGEAWRDGSDRGLNHAPAGGMEDGGGEQGVATEEHIAEQQGAAAPDGSAAVSEVEMAGGYGVDGGSERGGIEAGSGQEEWAATG